MRKILALYSNNNGTMPSPIPPTVGRLAVVSKQWNLTKFDVDDSDELHPPSTTLGPIVYNTSTNENFDSSEFATIAIKELISEHFKSSNVSEARRKYFSTVPNVTESDYYLSVQNISSLSCTTGNIPSANEYLAGTHLTSIEFSFSFGGRSINLRSNILGNLIEFVNP